jgi:hypothetical protein
MRLKSKVLAPMKPQEREHLEECLANVKSFVKIWLDFYLAFRRSYLGEPVTPEHESSFLRLKSEVAQRHQYLFDQMGSHYVGGAVITDLLRSVVNLEKIAKTQSENYYKVERNWHQFNMNLQDTVTSIQFRLEQEDQQT